MPGLRVFFVVHIIFNSMMMPVAEKPESDDDMPLRILNNASNDVQLVNCQESYVLFAGEEILTTLIAVGGFFIAPAGSEFNCSKGCEDCFYFQLQWSLDKGLTVRVGFGIFSEEKPSGGGIKLEVSKVGTAECTDAACASGWDKPMALDPSSPIVTVSVQGAGAAVEASNETVLEKMHHRRPGFRRPIYRRPIFRRPIYRRPIFRRPIYRPIYRPIFRRPVAPVCFFCSQYGFGSCWWLCR